MDALRKLAADYLADRAEEKMASNRAVAKVIAARQKVRKKQTEVQEHNRKTGKVKAHKRKLNPKEQKQEIAKELQEAIEDAKQQPKQ